MQRPVIALFVFLSIVFANLVRAEAPRRSAAVGLGQTLPRRAGRIRVVHRSIEGRHGYARDGGRESFGYQAKVRALANAFEYGWSKRLTLQAVFAHVYSNQASLDGEVFRKSALYKAKYREEAARVAKKMEPMCQGEQCLAWIEDGDFRLAHDTTIELPSAEQLTVSHDRSVDGHIDAVITHAAAPTAGRTGLGDTEFGALYGLVQRRDALISAGIGVRVPTGSFQDVPRSQRPTGGGVYDVGTRVNFDYAPIYGVWLSTQLQGEHAVTEAYRYRSGIMRPDRLNRQQPKERHTYLGLQRSILVAAQWGPGAQFAVLSPLSLGVHYRHTVSRTHQIDGRTYKPSSWIDYAGVTTSLDGLSHRIPLALDFSYEKPVGGQRALLATETTTITVKAYVLF